MLDTHLWHMLKLPSPVRAVQAVFIYINVHEMHDGALLNTRP